MRSGDIVNLCWDVGAKNKHSPIGISYRAVSVFLLNSREVTVQQHEREHVIPIRIATSHHTTDIVSLDVII